MKKTLYQDAHLHIKSGNNPDISPEIGRIFINATSSEDFSSVEASATLSTVQFFGVHSWFVTAQNISIDNIEAVEAEIKKTGFSGIGECGLDFSGSYNIYKNTQITAFESQVTLAQKYRRPMSIHCVKASDQLIKSLSKTAPLNTPFIMHSFYGSKDTLTRLLSLGAYISISRLSLKNPDKSHPVINSIPDSRLLIESDIFIGDQDYTIDKHLKILENNYKTVSEIKGISLDNLKEMVWDNGTIFTN